MNTRKREIAKAGIFGSIDNPTIVTEKDLKEIAETFPDIKKAPIQFGHWSDAASPRLGSVVSVAYDEAAKSLTAEIEEDDALAGAVDAGYYPDVSIGAKQRAEDGKMYLHHLAYLGEEAPAVKDLKTQIADGLQVAADDGKGVKQFPAPNEKRLYLSDTENKFESEIKTDKEVPMTEQEIEAMKAENARLKTESDAKEKLLSDQYAARKAEEKEALKKAVEGKLNEKETEKLLALHDSFEAERTIELSDSTKKSPAALLIDIFSGLPMRVEPGALNLSDTQPGTSNKADTSARQKMLNAV
jgi:hypothetical protein